MHSAEIAVTAMEQNKRMWWSWLIIIAMLPLILGVGLMGEREKAKAEKYLKISEALVERTELYTVSDPDAIIACDKNGKITVSNLAAERMFGWSHEELRNKPISILLPERIRAEHPIWMETARKEAEKADGDWMFRRTFDTHGLRRDGSEFPMRLTIRWIKYKGEVEFITNQRDLSEPLPPAELIPLPPIAPRIEESREQVGKELKL